jgi:predicted dehydrogenase
VYPRSVDACVIAAPTNQHAALIKRALAHDKHVMCEKPLTDNVDDTRTCYDLADSAHKHLFCAFTKSAALLDNSSHTGEQCRRFDPHYAKAFRLVHNGYVDKVRLITATLRDPAELMPAFLHSYIDSVGTNLIVDYSIHDIDSCVYLMNERPSTVFTLAHAHNELVNARARQSVYACIIFSCVVAATGTQLV